MKYSVAAIILCVCIGCAPTEKDFRKAAKLSGNSAKVRRDASQLPPKGLLPKDVPQFVILSFDDNEAAGYPPQKIGGGAKWALDFLRGLDNPQGSGQEATFDATPARATFFVVGCYLDRWKNQFSPSLRHAMMLMDVEGHEIASHSYTHARALREITHPEEWDAEIGRTHELFFRPDIDLLLCNPWLRTGGVKMDPKKMQGFRMPYMAYTEAGLQALARNGYRYDSSISEGMQASQTSVSMVWPYTLDGGSPGDRTRALREKRKAMGAIPGLWELPIHRMIVPSDEDCGRYGIAPGLRARIKEKFTWFNLDDGKIGGEDYTLMVTVGLSADEILATWKHTLDERYRGNRAPMMLLLHADMYASSYKATVPKISDYRERMRMVESFVRYALTKPDVRIVPARDVVDWLERPVALTHKKKLQTEQTEL
jgi:peptidoglycan/xylan/chitin deacetylase (PgdA/CDA1 family)